MLRVICVPPGGHSCVVCLHMSFGEAEDQIKNDGQPSVAVGGFRYILERAS